MLLSRYQLQSWIGLCILTFVTTQLITAESRADDLFLVPAEGGEATLLLSKPGHKLGSPQWSPDGKVIAMDTWERVPAKQNMYDAQIALYTLETKEFKILGIGSMPSWSPDGAQLVCHNYDPNQVVVLNVDGSGHEGILDQWGSPCWAPDGLSILTAYNRGGIARFNLQTGKQQVIAAQGAPLWQGFSVSPDGNGLCFGAHDDRSGIAIKDSTGHFRTEWKWPKFPGSYSTWSPDSKRIVALRRGVEGGRGWQLWYLDPYGDTEPTIVPGSDSKWVGVDPDWSPDGKWIVCTGKAKLETP